MRTKEAPMRMLLCLISAMILAAASVPASAQEKLTVYTYESFTADWGPGPAVKKAFEAECGCTVEFVSVPDGGSRPTSLGEIGLWRQGAGSLGQAQGKSAHCDAGMERGLRPVHQGRGVDGAVLHNLASLSHGRRKHRALPGGLLR